jgi:hypothetical protein
MHWGCFFIWSAGVITVRGDPALQRMIDCGHGIADVIKPATNAHQIPFQINVQALLKCKILIYS